jgi:short-subunit dehydrogenase involved in D-alanine esterification of teichoic acids
MGRYMNLKKTRKHLITNSARHTSSDYRKKAKIRQMKSCLKENKINILEINNSFVVQSEDFVLDSIENSIQMNYQSNISITNFKSHPFVYHRRNKDLRTIFLNLFLLHDRFLFKK